MNEYIEKLTVNAKKLDVYDVSKDILKDPKFSVWSGSSKVFQHHYGKGGLIRHTSEVVDLCFRVKDYYDYAIDPKELFLAALFHDVGKMYDYEPVNDNFNEWESTPHKRMIHHISRSGIIWSENAKKDDIIHKDYHDKVLHAILSHHMERAFGSPVAPRSRVAWLLTLCDNISARLFDADTWDVLDRNKE